MRQHKFRAFNVATKKFYYFDFNNNGTADTFFGRHGLKENGNWIISEYTNRLDKKRVEIFEGDIVRYISKYGNVSFTETYYLEVIAIPPSFELKVVKLFADHNDPGYLGDLGDYEFTDGRDDGGKFIDLIEDCVIIGNIYSNKELLK